MKMVECSKSVASPLALFLIKISSLASILMNIKYKIISDRTWFIIDMDGTSANAAVAVPSINLYLYIFFYLQRSFTTWIFRPFSYFKWFLHWLHLKVMAVQQPTMVSISLHQAHCILHSITVLQCTDMQQSAFFTLQFHYITTTSQLYYIQVQIWCQSPPQGLCN